MADCTDRHQGRILFYFYFHFGKVVTAQNFSFVSSRKEKGRFFTYLPVALCLDYDFAPDVNCIVHETAVLR